MSIDQITNVALGLPPKDRAVLAESLWESLEEPFTAPGELDDDAALALARERDRQIESGEVKPISHQDLMARLRS